MNPVPGRTGCYTNWYSSDNEFMGERRKTASSGTTTLGVQRTRDHFPQRDNLHYINYSILTCLASFHEATYDYHGVELLHSDKRPFILTRGRTSLQVAKERLPCGPVTCPSGVPQRYRFLVLTWGSFRDALAGADTLAGCSSRQRRGGNQTGHLVSSSRAHAHIDSRRREPLGTRRAVLPLSSRTPSS